MDFLLPFLKFSGCFVTPVFIYPSHALCLCDLMTVSVVCRASFSLPLVRLWSPDPLLLGEGLGVEGPLLCDPPAGGLWPEHVSCSAGHGRGVSPRALCPCAHQGLPSCGACGCKACCCQSQAVFGAAQLVSGFLLAWLAPCAAVHSLCLQGWGLLGPRLS